jgi:hypothetical protein
MPRGVHGIFVTTDSRTSTKWSFDPCVHSIEQFAQDKKVLVVQFEKGLRKDDIGTQHRAEFRKPEAVIFIELPWLPSEHSSGVQNHLQAIEQFRVVIHSGAQPTGRCDWRAVPE